MKKTSRSEFFAITPTEENFDPTPEEIINAKTYSYPKPFSLHDPFVQIRYDFYSAKEYGRANVATYNQYIKDAGRANQFSEAQKAFDEAKELRLANVTTYSHYIESAILAGQREEAERALAGAEISGLEVSDEMRSKVSNFINQ